jgi:hypothetical protein
MSRRRVIELPYAKHAAPIPTAVMTDYGVT